MRKILPFVVVSCFLAAPARADLSRVVASDAGSVTVEITIPEPRVAPFETGSKEPLCVVSVPGFFTYDREGAPLLPVRRFFFEVPSAEGVSMRILEVEPSFAEGVLPRVFLEKGTPDAERRALESQPRLEAQSFARFSGVGTYRGRHIAFVDVRPVLFDPERRGISYARRILLRLAFPAVSGVVRRGEEHPIFGGITVNGEQAASWPRPAAGRGAARTPYEFALSEHWLKMRVSGKGLYAVTYNDLLALALDPSTIDPATIRIFSGGAAQEPDSIDRGGSFRDDAHLVEHAALYRGSGAGEFGPGDTILFYGLGASGWEKDYDPSKDARAYREHLYSSTNCYWLTWGGSFSGSPRRMLTRDVSPAGSADTTITSYEERIHREEDQLYDPVYTDDRWYWRLLKENGISTFTDAFYCYDLAGSNGVVKTLGYGPHASTRAVHTAQYSVNDAVAGSLTWSVPFGYNPGGMKTLVAPVSNLVQGTSNTFKVTKASDDEAYVFWYEVFYRRLLRARLGAFDFYAPARPLRGSFALSGFPAGERLLLEVTTDESPVLCTGWQATAGGITFEDSLAGRERHYLAVSRSAFAKPSIEVRRVPSLRDESECPDMLIIYNARFENAAVMLRDHHRRSLAGIASPVVKAVDVEDVYDNFSGGLKDPVAIRNYLKFLYDRPSCSGSGEPSLRYVLLLGNGTYDPRDVLGQANDFIPLYINIKYRNEEEGIEDEDFFVKLDGGLDPVPDVAIGRMSALTEREATAWAERIVAQSETPVYGAWRDKVILCADDEHSTATDYDFDFLLSSEELAGRMGPFPRLIDIEKIYLHLYPFVGDVKPAARSDFLREWSDGAAIVNFNGHGSPVQMADERVMVASDVYSLTNADRRPLFLSFSCSVGDLESPYHRSMAQNLVTSDQGGAIATIAAAAPTYLYPNKLLNEEIFNALFTSKDSTGTEPVGTSLQLAKLSIAGEESYYESNNTKYILLGDPALTLPIPKLTVQLETGPIATMKTGHRYRVEGSVRRGGAIDATFNGTADVTVQEAERNVRESVEGFTIPYTILGRELFRGTFDVANGRFSADFVVPRRCHTGFGARIRSYVTSSAIDGVGACDTLRIELADTLPTNEGAPSVNLYFSGGATKVKEGARLVAEISDPDGIAMLGADPQSSIFLEFDGSGYPVYVTDFFAYDHGSSTTGKVEYPLQSGLAAGPHTVLIKAFDNLGLAGSDTLRFEIVEEGLYTVSDVFSFPNPFTTVTNFVFQVTNRADATLAVYSVSGVKVWEGKVAAEEGFNSIPWDGRDTAGGRVANGTYLYVLTVDFPDSYHREETIRGKVVLLR